MDKALIAGVDCWPFRFLKTLGKLFTRASVTKQYNLARLVLGWVTAFGRTYHLGMLPAN